MKAVSDFFLPQAVLSEVENSNEGWISTILQTTAGSIKQDHDLETFAHQLFLSEKKTLVALFLNPDLNISDYLISRMFLSHARAMELSESFDEGVSEFQNFWGFESTDSESLVSLFRLFKYKAPGLVDSFIDAFLSDAEESFEEIVDSVDLKFLRKMKSSPQKGSILYVISNYIKQERTSDAQAKLHSANSTMKKLALVFKEGFLNSNSKINTRTYLLLRLVADKPLARHLSAREDVDDLLREGLSIDNSSKSALTRSIRVMLSYHPEIIEKAMSLGGF